MRDGDEGMGPPGMERQGRLCNACNSKKGDRSQAELIAALRTEGVIS